MTDLTERLKALRDAPARGLDGREDYFLDHDTRELLAEAANRIEELEGAIGRVRYWARGGWAENRAAPLTIPTGTIDDHLERGRWVGLSDAAREVLAALNPEGEYRCGECGRSFTRLAPDHRCPVCHSGHYGSAALNPEGEG